MPQLTDRATFDASQRTRDARGFLHAPVVFARTGIQVYTAGEIEAPGRAPGDVVRILRPAEEVFAADTLAAFRGLPVTDDHPAEDVTPANFSKLAKGFSPDEAVEAGETATGRIVVSDAAMIAKVEGGKVEVSVGYHCDVEWSPGESPFGAYDGIQRAIRPNHLAVVSAGRCGATCRIADNVPACECDVGTGCNCKPEAEAMADETPKITKKVVDGFGLVATTDEGFAVIDSLRADVKAKTEAMSAKDGEIAAAAAAHAAAIAAKDAEIAALQAAAVTDADLDARVAARSALLADAARLFGDGFEATGKDDATIRREVVTKALGDAAVKDQDDAFVSAAFRTLSIATPAAAVSDGKATTDPIRDALSGGAKIDDANDPEKARAAYLADMLNPAAQAAA